MDISFTVSPACAGGNHFNVTANINGKTIVIAQDLPSLSSVAVSESDLATCAKVIAQMIIASLAKKDHAAISLAMNNQKVTIDPTGLVTV